MPAKHGTGMANAITASICPSRLRAPSDCSSNTCHTQLEKTSINEIFEWLIPKYLFTRLHPSAYEVISTQTGPPRMCSAHIVAGKRPTLLEIVPKMTAIAFFRLGPKKAISIFFWRSWERATISIDLDFDSHITSLGFDTSRFALPSCGSCCLFDNTQ